MSKKTKITNPRRRGRRKERTDDEEMVDKEPKGSFAWKLFLPSQIKMFVNCETPEELEEKMAIALNLDQYEVGLREGAQVDFYMTAFHWACERLFDDRQLGGFMGLMSVIFDNLKEHSMTKVENISFLKDCFAGVGLDNPEHFPISLYFFTLEQAKDVMEYLLTTFFQHYDLYDYMFKIEQDELIIGTFLNVDVCPEDIGPVPPPLEEGMSKDVYGQFVLENHPEPEEEEEPDAASEDGLANALSEIVLKAVEESPDESVKNVSSDKLQEVIMKVINELTLPAEKELKEKIKDKTDMYLAKIGKIQLK